MCFFSGSQNGHDNSGQSGGQILWNTDENKNRTVDVLRALAIKIVAMNLEPTYEGMINSYYYFTVNPKNYMISIDAAENRIVQRNHDQYDTYSFSGNHIWPCSPFPLLKTGVIDGIEMLNEPWTTVVGGPITLEELRAFYQEAGLAIRSTGFNGAVATYI